MKDLLTALKAKTAHLSVCINTAPLSQRKLDQLNGIANELSAGLSELETLVPAKKEKATAKTETEDKGE